MAFTAFYDTSGRQESSPFISTAGAVATPENWVHFEREWRAVLDAESIREFSHACFKHSEDEFRAWRGDEPRRRAFMSALLDVMERRLSCWHASGIHPRTFKRLSEYYDMSAFGGAYMISAAFAHRLVEQWRDEAHPNDPLLHVFEKGDSGQTPIRRIEDLGPDTTAQPKYEERRGYIYAFQAADLIAGELTTQMAGIRTEDRKRLLRAPLQRLHRIPGKNANADLFVLADVCRRLPRLFPPIASDASSSSEQSPTSAPE